MATAYPDLGQAVNELQVAQDFDGIKASMRENRQRALDAPPSVLGTAARSGVSRLLIGNTAEALMARMSGDLLTVRAPWS